MGQADQTRITTRHLSLPLVGRVARPQAETGGGEP